MRRRRMSKGASKRLFRFTARKVHKKNLVKHTRRGGYCL